MNRALGAIAYFSITTMLAGCGSLYYAPKSGSQASFKVSNASAATAALPTMFDNADCTGGIPVSYDFIAPGGVLDLKVDAGNPITFVVTGDRGSKVAISVGSSLQRPSSITQADLKQCHAPGRFTPSTGRVYEVVYSDDGLQCDIAVFELTQADKIPQSFEKLSWHKGVKNNRITNCASQ